MNGEAELKPGGEKLRSCSLSWIVIAGYVADRDECCLRDTNLWYVVLFWLWRLSDQRPHILCRRLVKMPRAFVRVLAYQLLSSFSITSASSESKSLALLFFLAHTYLQSQSSVTDLPNTPPPLIVLFISFRLYWIRVPSIDFRIIQNISESNKPWACRLALLLPYLSG
jgi:hypothetical protein